MDVKIVLYIISAFLIMWSIESVNINAIFKKNREMQARLFYFVITLCLIELLTEFLYNLLALSNIL